MYKKLECLLYNLLKMLDISCSTVMTVSERVRHTSGTGSVNIVSARSDFIKNESKVGRFTTTPFAYKHK